MLQVRSVDDIKYKEVNPETGRISIVPNLVDVLYVYKSFLFAYDTISHIPKEFSHLPIPNIADSYAKFSKVVYHFKDRESTEIVTFPYYLIEIWREIGAEYRDIFLMHELSEMQHKVIGKQSRQIAHERAKRKTEDYTERYFKPKEIEEFQKMLELLPKKRTKQSDVKILLI